MQVKKQPGKDTRDRGIRRVYLVLLIFLAALSICGCKQEQQAAAPAEAAPEVEVAKVIQKNVPVHSEWVGTTDGLVNAKIRAQVTGYLQKQDYKEGAFIKKGVLLFEIDPRTFKAALDQAEGQLAQARARLGKTELDVKRYTPLAREGAISKQELDDAIQANLAAKASVDTALAAVESARLNLGFTRVTSPIDGIAGSANAQIGDLVGPQTSELTTVSTIDPIKVYFSISEREYLTFAEKINTPDQKSRESILDLILADGSIYPHKGQLSYADRQVDAKTGTIRVAALFPNSANLLRPGQFARIRALVKTRENALLVPQRAVTEMQGSYQVAVVGEDNKVHILPVKVSDRIENLWVVDEGIKPGEHVVVEGIQKVKEGMVVKPKLIEAQAQKSPAAAQVTDGKSAQKPSERRE